MKLLHIGSKSGIDPAQIDNRIEIQLRLEDQFSHPEITFLYIEVQPPGNLNRGLTNQERKAIDRALDNGFRVGFEFPHLWSGRDIDPCVPESIKDMLEIAAIANDIGSSYLFTNAGDIHGKNYNAARWGNARHAHLEVVNKIKKINNCFGIENTNPIRYLDNGTALGFFGMLPEDLLLFDFVVLDIAHAQFTVNHFNSQDRLESIRALGEIHKRKMLSLSDYAVILKDKIKVIHVANSTGLGDIDKEGLRISEGDADCRLFLTDIFENRNSPIHLIAEPSHIPYGLDYLTLGELMYLEEKEIFEICCKILKEDHMSDSNKKN